MANPLEELLRQSRPSERRALAEMLMGGGVPASPQMEQRQMPVIVPQGDFAPMPQAPEMGETIPMPNAMDMQPAQRPRRRIEDEWDYINRLGNGVMGR